MSLQETDDILKDLGFESDFKFEKLSPLFLKLILKILIFWT